MNRYIVIVVLALLCVAALATARAETPIGTSFTYQGQLKSGGSPVSGMFDMAFALWSDQTSNAAADQVGPTLFFDDGVNHFPRVSVTNGLFAVALDFGAGALTGSKRWLEITVGTATLSPRQEVTPAPYAVYAANAGYAAAPWAAVSGGLSYASGNVGIGTTTPGFPISLANTLGDKISLWGQWGGYPHYGFGVQGGLLQIHSDFSTSDIAFGHGSSAYFAEVMRIKGTGSVGIGTQTPIAPLDVRQLCAVTNASSNARVLIGVNQSVDSGYLQVVGPSSVAIAGLGGATSGNLFCNAADGSNTIAINGTGATYFTGGDVGIGTASPSAPLDVRGSSVITDTAGHAKVNAGVDASSDAGYVRTYSPSSLVITGLGGTDAGQIFCNAAGTMNALIDANGPSFFKGGNVGIGTTSPQAPLDVRGSSVITDAGGSPKAMLNAAGNSYFNGGNFGVGTNSPAAKLDIRGEMKFGANGEYSPAAAVENIRIIRGVVNYDGNIISGSGFSAVKNSTGDFTLTWTQPFNDLPAVTVNAFTASNGSATLGLLSNSHVTVYCWNFGGAPGNYTFAFTAIGGR